MDLAGHREEYVTQGLDIDQVLPDPIAQFQAWFREVDAAGLWEPNAMVVSAVDTAGWPTSRFVLLKQVDSDGFVFYTNYTSAKAQALDHSGRAAITFGWHELRRQVRVLGLVERLDPADSDAYFALRPRGSQLGAWASPQSQPVESRDKLEERYEAITTRFGDGDGDIPRPEHWGGYRIRPQTIEFWQGRPNRFHDRIVYTAETPGQPDTAWTRQRLAP